MKEWCRKREIKSNDDGFVLPHYSGTIGFLLPFGTVQEGVMLFSFLKSLFIIKVQNSIEFYINLVKGGFHMEQEKVPIHLKMTLSIKEAAEYSNIGINKIDSMLRSPNCPFVLFVGTKKLVKRKEFEQYISQKLVI